MPSPLYQHHDVLDTLNKDVPLSSKLEAVHRQLKDRYPFIDRIAVAVYDPKSDLLKTFVHSSNGETPLAHYQAKLSEASSLQDMLDNGRPRVVNDLDIFSASRHEHAQQIAQHEYRASYTLPMYVNGVLFGFVFFNSKNKNVFTDNILHQLDLVGHLIILMITNELASIKTLLATVKTARELTHHRDPETGAHLDRMSRYAQLIAKELADEYGFDDEYIEHVFLFAPLHDIGKIGVPDEILLKRGPLTAEEYEAMKTHALKGRRIIDSMLQNFGLTEFQHIDIMRNIAELHHEAIGGQGYPHGLKYDEIPIESRIVAVADVFDALTSRRPYKEAWSNDDAFAMLHKMAAYKLDPACVDALIRRRNEIEEIQKRYQETEFA